MKVGKVDIAYPYVEYKVSIDHVTTRKSTVIEWVILESLRISQGKVDLGGLSLASVFEDVLKVSDSDLLVKPCLIGLQDLQAINIRGLSDDTSLKNLTLNDIQLTKEGALLQQTGRLPGKVKEERDDYSYDVYKDSIVRGIKKGLDNSPRGFKVSDNEEALNIIFPQQKIKLELEDVKKKNKYNWLEATTIITNIKPVESELKWLNIQKDIEITNMNMISVEGEKENSLVNAEVFGDDVTGIDDERISDLEIDLSNVKELFLHSFIEKKFTETLTNSINKIEGRYKNASKGKKIKSKTDMILIDNRFRDKSLKLNQFDVKIYFNSDRFKFDINKTDITLEIPEDITEKGCIFSHDKEAIFVGASYLYNNFDTKKFKFGYKLEDSDIKDIEILSAIIDKYNSKNQNIIAIAGVKSQPFVLEKLSKYLEKLDCISDKFDLINSIKKINKDIFDKNIDANNLYKEIIILEIEKFGDINSSIELESISHKLKVYNNYLIDIKNLVRDKVVENIKYVTNYSDIKAIYVNLYQGKGEKIEKLERLYTEPVLRSIYSKFMDDGRIDEITKIDRTFNLMKLSFKKISNYLEDLDLRSNLSNKVILESIVKNIKHLGILRNEYLNLLEYQSELSDKISNLESFAESCGLYNIFDNISKIGEELSKFMNESGLQYKNILVIDTCSVIENSDELTKLTKFKDTLVIVPSMVLSELDKLKGANDDEISFKARKAIRIINENNNEIKFENGDIELLPKDIADINNERGDKFILAVAMKYFTDGVVLITEDKNFRNIAKSQGIESVEFRQIGNMRQFIKKNKSDKKKAKKKEKRENSIHKKNNIEFVKEITNENMYTSNLNEGKKKEVINRENINHKKNNIEFVKKITDENMYISTLNKSKRKKK